MADRPRRAAAITALTRLSPNGRKKPKATNNTHTIQKPKGRKPTNTNKPNTPAHKRSNTKTNEDSDDSSSDEDTLSKDKEESVIASIQ